MPIIFPDYLKVNNSNEPIVRLEDKQVKGASIVADVSARNLIGSSLRTEGYQAYVQSTDKTYTYVGTDLGDAAWQTESNWKADWHIFDQSGSASNTWVINHYLNKFPSVMVVDNDGDHVEGYTIVYNSLTQVTLSFKSAGNLIAISGKAYLN